MSQIYKNNSGSGPVTDDLHVARFIVSAGGGTDGANYTTLAAAYAAAVSAGGSQTVFLQPGTYSIGTQALVDGVNISAFDCDALTPTVILNGKLTADLTGECSFSGIQFTNASDVFLEITGSATCVFNFTQCNLNVAAASFGISNTNPTCLINCYTTHGDITGTSAYFNFTAGAINTLNSHFYNNSNSSTNNIFDNASLNLNSTFFSSPITASGTGGDLSIISSTMICTDVTAITTSGANSDLIISNSYIDSNAATAVSIGASSTLTMTGVTLGSTATDAISGAGTLRCTPISFIKSSSNINVGALVELPFQPLTVTGKDQFSTYLSAPTANVTGDGTTYGPIVFDAVLSNTLGSYDPTTGIFTAAKTTVYSFDQTVAFLGGSAITTDYVTAWSGSAFQSRAFQVSPIIPPGGGAVILSATITIPMNAGDTMSVSVNVSGAPMGSPDVQVFGGAPAALAVTSLFSGSEQ